MTEQAIRQLIARMAVDTEFAEKVRSDPSVLSGYELTGAEIRRLSELTGEHAGEATFLGERLSRSGLFFPSAGHFGAAAGDPIAHLHPQVVTDAHLNIGADDHHAPGGHHDAAHERSATEHEATAERDTVDPAVVSQLAPVLEPATHSPAEIPLPADLAAIFGHHDGGALHAVAAGAVPGEPDPGMGGWAHEGGGVTNIYEGGPQPAGMGPLPGDMQLTAEAAPLGSIALLPHSVTVPPSDIPVIGDLHGELESIPLIGGLVQLGDTLGHVVEGAAGEVVHYVDPLNW